MLRTKLNRPQISSGDIYREHLVQQMNQSIDKPLSLISAGAGYGKSSLVRSWLDNNEYKYVWYSIDEDDNDLQLFLNNLCEAIDTIQPEATNNFQSYISGPNLPPTKELAHSLINDLDLLKDDFVLVLDDFHSIKNQELIEIIKILLSYPPEGLHLVIITRIDPPLNISSLRAHSRLNEIRMTDLAFSEDEIVDLISETHNEVLKKETIIEIKEATEGWVTAIKLIGLAVDEFDKGDDLIPNIKNKSHFVKDFLFDEVFKHQSEEIKKLLLVSSLFGQFTAEFLDSLFDESTKMKTSGDEFILYLKKFNLFVISLDAEDKWYRLHHLFQELLLGVAKKTLSDQEIKDVYLREGHWLSKEKLATEAIDCFVLAEDYDLAIEIIDDYRGDFHEFGGAMTVDRWASKIPEKVSANQPVLLITEAWSLFAKFRMDLLPPLLEQIDELLAKNSDNNIAKEVSFFRGNLLYWSGDAEGGAVHLNELYGIDDDLPRYLRINLYVIWSFANHMLGEEEMINDELRKKLATTDLQDIATQTYLLASLAYINLLSGNLGELRSYSFNMAKVTNASSNGNLKAWTDYLLAQSYFHSMELEIAQIHFEAAAKFGISLDLRALIDTMAAEAISARLNGEVEASRKAFNKLVDFVEEQKDPYLDLLLESCRTRLNLLDNKATDSMGWVFGLTEVIDNASFFIWVDVPEVTHVRQLLYEGSAQSLESATKLITNLESVSKKARFIGQHIEVEVLHSILLYKRQSVDEAVTLLRAILLEGIALGYTRPFVEPGHQILPILELLEEEFSDNKTYGQICQDIKELISPMLVLAPTPVVEPNDSEAHHNNFGLTPREIVTIEHLYEGLRNKEIAGKMFVTVDAVKKHLYRIFLKMDVKSRIELVNKAQDHNLLNLVK